MFNQVELKYAFNALEPHIDETTMITHYTKHHAAYAANFNAALEKLPELAGKNIAEIMAAVNTLSDPALKNAVRNNGGGTYNHNLYFSLLSPNGGGDPEGALLKAIEKDFGSADTLRDKLSAAAMGRFGSGWAWLSADAGGKLIVSSTANQDNPIMEDASLTPILGIDVWEHAYYLKYKNLRADYIKAFFHIVDWRAVAKLYEATRA